MKIAFPVFDYSKPGGIERSVRILTQIMSSKGHEVHVFTTNCGGTENKAIRFHKINVIKSMPFFLQLIEFNHKINTILRKDDFDIINSQGADCNVHNVLTAQSCHKAWVEKAKTFSVWERMKKIYYPLHRFVLRNEKYNFSYGNYNRIVVLSNVLKKEIISYYSVPDEKISVVYPGVNLAEFKDVVNEDDRNVIRESLCIERDDFVMLFVANEFRRKGLSTIINAIGILKERKIKLIVIGKGNKYPYILLARRKNVDKQIRFIPQTDKISFYYTASDLFVLPTKHEAFGMVITEAMASGLPVIVSKFAGAAELINERQCLLDNPLDFREIAEKIKCFSNDKAYAKHIGNKLRKIVDDYTWEKTVDETLAVYEKAIKSNNQTRR